MLLSWQVKLAGTNRQLGVVPASHWLVGCDNDNGAQAGRVGLAAVSLSHLILLEIGQPLPPLLIRPNVRFCSPPFSLHLAV
jgi:hypothetical protein